MNIQQFDSLLPTITGRESTAELAQMVMSFTQQLVEQLEFNLSNLDSSNFNTQGLENLQLDTTKELREAIKKIAKQLQEVQKALDTDTKLLQELDTKVKENTETISKVSNNADTNRKNIVKVLALVQPKEGGGGSVGQEGKRLDLIGDIYINGVPNGG